MPLTLRRFSIVRLSYLRVFQHEFPNSQGVDLSQFGAGWGSLAGQLVAPANFPAMNFNDSLGVTGSNGIGSELFWHQNVYGLSGTLTKIVGRHQLKFGGRISPRAMDFRSRKRSTYLELRPGGYRGYVRRRRQRGGVGTAWNHRRTRHTGGARYDWRLQSVLQLLRFLC